jgi:hypothetical protein
MSDPLADPRATDLLGADPNDVASLAAVFRTAASESLQTETGLRAAQHDGVWTGASAEAFRRAIGRLPVELGKLHAGFQGVAEALSAYESGLSSIKPAFVRVIAELANVESRLRPAQAAAQAAAVALRSIARSPSATIASLTHAELAAGRADGVVASLQVDAGRLMRRAFELLDEFSSAREACRQAIAVASQIAPARPLSGQGTTVIGLTLESLGAAHLTSFNTIVDPLGL